MSLISSMFAAGRSQPAAAGVHGEPVCDVEGDAGARVQGVGVADVQGLGEVLPRQHRRLRIPGQRAAGAPFPFSSFFLLSGNLDLAQGLSIQEVH